MNILFVLLRWNIFLREGGSAGIAFYTVPIPGQSLNENESRSVLGKNTEIFLQMFYHN